ncbi:MAG: hypothetical protein AAB590_01085 [Patescibacteria group bacterium]
MTEQDNSGWVWGILLIVVLAWLLWPMIKPSETEGKWRATYYPDGCLNCSDRGISSPFFDTVNECTVWVHQKKLERNHLNNSMDTAECGFDCKMNYDLGAGIEVCKETVDVFGKPSF